MSSKGNKMKSNIEIENSIRRTWQINPVTRIKKSKKVYSRKNYKIEKE